MICSLSMELKFKKIVKSDSENLANWLSSDEWPFFLGRTPAKDEVLKRIEEGNFFGEGDLNFWIFNGDEIPIGLIEIYQLDDLAPMFSIRFKSEFRGKGFGKPTLDWLTRYVFENYPDKRRIEGQTREDNVPMRKVFNKCGYVKEAYYRLASPTENRGRVASIAYGILREDWQSNTLTPVLWESDSFFAGDKYD
jgi:RimJ/RimL family protein N-acetyltransferase